MSFHVSIYGSFWANLFYLICNLKESLVFRKSGVSLALSYLLTSSAFHSSKRFETDFQGIGDNSSQEWNENTHFLLKDQRNHFWLLNVLSSNGEKLINSINDERLSLKLKFYNETTFSLCDMNENRLSILHRSSSVKIASDLS